MKEEITEKKKGFWECLFEPTKHDWELIHTEVLPSVAETASQVGVELNFRRMDTDNIFRKCLVQTFKCKLTGEIRIEKTYHPKLY